MGARRRESFVAIDPNRIPGPRDAPLDLPTRRRRDLDDVSPLASSRLDSKHYRDMYAPSEEMGASASGRDLGPRRNGRQFDRRSWFRFARRKSKPWNVKSHASSAAQMSAPETLANGAGRAGFSRSSIATEMISQRE